MTCLGCSWTFARLPTTAYETLQAAKETTSNHLSVEEATDSSTPVERAPIRPRPIRRVRSLPSVAPSVDLGRSFNVDKWHQK
jgi:hypothetical protein